eukprot:jgi/Tetstr1/443596/TSEL_031595.t1
MALTCPAALLRAVRLRTIVIYLTESEFDPSELLAHLFSQTVKGAGELGGDTGHNQLRRTSMGMCKKARKTHPASLALRAEHRPVYTLTPQLTAHHHNIIGGTRRTDRTEQWPTTPAATAMTEVQADDEAELELNYEENDSTMDVDTAQRGAAAAPGLADNTLDSPQRSIVQRTFREGTPNGTTERLIELQHLTTTTAELLAHTSPASQPALAAEMA